MNRKDCIVDIFVVTVEINPLVRHIYLFRVSVIILLRILSEYDI